MLRSAACGSPICPASACTTIAVTWWPTTSCSSRARLVRCSSQTALPRRVWAWSVSCFSVNRDRSSNPSPPPRATAKEAGDGGLVGVEDETADRPGEPEDPADPRNLARVLDDRHHGERGHGRPQEDRVRSPERRRTPPRSRGSVERNRRFGTEAARRSAGSQAATKTECRLALEAHRGDHAQRRRAPPAMPYAVPAQQVRVLTQAPDGVHAASVPPTGRLAGLGTDSVPRYRAGPGPEVRGPTVTAPRVVLPDRVRTGPSSP